MGSTRDLSVKASLRLIHGPETPRDGERAPALAEAHPDDDPSRSLPSLR